jgi:SAM-dependent methyltransferase
VDGYTASTYGDAFADVYDDWYADVGDRDAAVATLVDLAAGGRVLELGVGSGRLAAGVAAAGVEVWGIDASAAMLERLAAAARDVHGVLGDMREPATVVDGPFSVVVAAFNTFFLLTTEDAQRACLRSSASLLGAGGVVALECYVPADPPDGGVERVLEPRRVEVDRVVLTVTEHDVDAQVVRGQHVELRESGTRLRPWVLRYATPTQLDDLAAGAGLGLLERWGGWDRSPFDPAGAMHVSLYGAL